MTTLVIVESPVKCKTIQKYLDSLWGGGKYIVKASSGHFCDLPPKKLGFDTSNFNPYYVVNNAEVLRELKTLARQSEDVILATDSDREGEAIAAHLRRELGLLNPDRIVYNEITKGAIQEAMKSPRKIIQQKVDSQETRRIVDRMIGWIVSPLTRAYIAPEGSAGRVQTVILLILKLLEDAIKGFKSVRHYQVSLMMLNNEKNPAEIWSAAWDSKLWRLNDEKYWLDRNSAEKIKGIKSLVVESVEKTEDFLNPPAPLITSTLQRAAEINLNLTPKQTMDIAQKLYEAGVITYMRTDNPNLSLDSFNALKAYAKTIDLKVEDDLRSFKTKKNAQEAHEAIRPTSFALTKVGEGDVQKLYELIWNRAVASQMPAARYDVCEVRLVQDVEVTLKGVTETKSAAFVSKARKLTYAGWRDLTNTNFSEEESADSEQDDQIGTIPLLLNVGDVIEVKDGVLHEKNTQAPRRYSAASLIDELERSGIGRPSTYATLMEKIFKSGYIRYEKKRIFLTEIGYKIVEQMQDDFSFIDVKYTAEMEEMLDSIELGSVDFKSSLKAVWENINKEAKTFEEKILKSLPQHPCELCGSLLLQKKSGDYSYWKCRNRDCGAVYSDLNDKPDALTIQYDTEFKCLECDGHLIYKKSSKNGVPSEQYRCSRSKEKDACMAKYPAMLVDGEPQPDFATYKENTRFKCLVCSRPILRKSKDKDGETYHYWGCTGYRVEKPLCKAFYGDLNGVPDFAKYELNHKYHCPVCENFLSRYKRKDGSGFFWYCGHKIKRVKCETYLDDSDSSPDFDKFQKEYEINHKYQCFNEGCGGFYKRIEKKENAGVVWRCQKCGDYCEDKDESPDQEDYEKNHTHKCVACSSYLKYSVTRTNKVQWRCMDKECALIYEDVEGVPDLESKKEKLIHKCDRCAKGYLMAFTSQKTGKTLWSCSNYDGCGVRYADKDDAPDLKKVLQ